LETEVSGEVAGDEEIAQNTEPVWEDEKPIWENEEPIWHENSETIEDDGGK
jgi:hypothetical protein